LCPELAAVLGSLLAYFFYIVTAFAAVTGLMIAVLGDSTLGKVLHYPRPVVERAVTAEIPGHRLFMFATNARSPAKNAPETDVKSSSVVPVATADAGKRDRLAHPRKLATRRENYEGHDYSVALGYGARSGYRPGLDGQR
jgi:hypothetical protein